MVLRLSPSRRLRAAQTTGTQTVWDLFHYGWPDWLELFESRFIDAFVRFAREFARIWSNETEDTLFVAPVNAMAGVPIEALTDQYTVSYTPSGTYLVRLRERLD